MKRQSLAVFLLSAALVVQGCDSGIADPQRTTPIETSPSLSASGAGSGVRHVLIYSGGAPAGLEAEVTRLGGTVALNHRSGVVLVQDLSDSAAAALMTATGASSVAPEPDFELVQPAVRGEPVRMSQLQSSPTGAILYSEQWNLHAIRAELAWNAGRTGSAAVRVAILDTGIDYLLPDMAGRVDLERSASFVPFDNAVTALFFPGRHPSTDLHYHGTNVATQVSSNAWAFAGVTSQTTLISVKVCSFQGGCPGVIAGILHAVDVGADVINMSLGGWFRKSAFPGQMAALNQVMNYARNQGVTIVVSAGNSSIDLDRNRNVPVQTADGVERIHIPSLFSTYCDAIHVICVSAVGRGDVPASYTNFGRSAIDVSAPGGDAPAGDWVYSLCPQTSLIYYCEDGYYPIGLAGTSQAAPHVAGLAALAIEDVGRSPSRVRAYIRNSAERIGGGNSAHHGRGRIDVARAVGAAH